MRKRSPLVGDTNHFSHLRLVALGGCRGGFGLVLVFGTLVAATTAVTADYFAAGTHDVSGDVDCGGQTLLILGVVAAVAG